MANKSAERDKNICVGGENFDGIHRPTHGRRHPFTMGPPPFTMHDLLM